MYRDYHYSIIIRLSLGVLIKLIKLFGILKKKQQKNDLEEVKNYESDRVTEEKFYK